MKTERKTKKRGALLASLQSLEPGDSFYTDMLAKGVTAYSSFYKIAVKTEVCLLVTDKSFDC